MFNCTPRTAEGAKFREGIVIGTTTWTSTEISTLISSLSEEYVGNRYNLISRNCNHFAEDLCKRITGVSIPGFVNRIAKIGYMFHCLVPPKMMGPGPVVQTAPKALGPNKSNFSAFGGGGQSLGGSGGGGGQPAGSNSLSFSSSGAGASGDSDSRAGSEDAMTRRERMAKAAMLRFGGDAAAGDS